MWCLIGIVAWFVLGAIILIVCYKTAMPMPPDWQEEEWEETHRGDF